MNEFLLTKANMSMHTHEHKHTRTHTHLSKLEGYCMFMYVHVDELFPK